MQPSLYIIFVKELRKQDCVTKIHNKGYSEVLPGLAAAATSRLDEVGPHVDANADEHLQDLHAGDADFHPFRDVVTEGPEGIVGVHEGVDAVIDDDEPTSWSCVSYDTVPDIAEDSDVMIPM